MNSCIEYGIISMKIVYLTKGTRNVGSVTVYYV